MRKWDDMDDDRDEAGNLTSLAQAIEAIQGTGCDCGTDEPGSCIVHRCEIALHEQFDEIEKLRAENADLRHAILVRSLGGEP